MGRVDERDCPLPHAPPLDRAMMISKMEIGARRTIAGDIDVLLGIPSSSRWGLARYDGLIENARARPRRAAGARRLARGDHPLQGDGQPAA
jgi:hypothetical protein